jgi:hypothetical protein
MWRRVRESNPGHSGERQAHTPLRHPCFPWGNWLHIVFQVLYQSIAKQLRHHVVQKIEKSEEIRSIRAPISNCYSISAILVLDMLPSFLKNWYRVPIKSPKVRLRSATKPSIWWNSARWVASRVSLRNTRSIEKNLAGVNVS